MIQRGGGNRSLSSSGGRRSLSTFYAVKLGPLRPMLPGGPKGLARHGPCFWTVPIISRFEAEIEPHDRDMVLLSKSTQAELTTSLKGSISGDDAGERAGHLRR
ncbi:hypothetical protein SAY87_028167 [Trapa incisa]|uniref:Uncharacterized protein n=1 Tax=Trapa incisa TaxID=236973 RepID=A0AAN7QRD0_9MYRT|nr:hypothetical protein SAY87_028167 [Trapa incisa]